MDSRVRWHESECNTPSVFVDGGVPRCRSCNATSADLVAQLVVQNRALGGAIRLPVEAPLGHADLWWPPSVPFRRPCVDRLDPGTDSEFCSDDTHPSAVSLVYQASLDASHFRLLYLTGAEAILSPIHIQLQEYAFEDRPEYETVSYAWGGEDGDSTLCRPVYVGAFWDVILVTDNCSALLHYLRPRKGCRVVWLDAICINQADNVEKSAQISRMGDIYANGERVVVYFGQDLIQPPRGRLFRPRVECQSQDTSDKVRTAEFFTTCAENAGVSQNQLLERRYLARIWIVQELVLSRKALFPFGGTDILCDCDLATHLLFLRTTGQLTGAFAGWGSFSRLLKATSHCQSSDPRDRIYGLLSLYRPAHGFPKVNSDYSLSWRDCWLGIGAYMILVEQNLALLTHAVGATHPLYLPSWVPNIQRTESWPVGSTAVDSYSDMRRRWRNGAPQQWATEFVLFSINYRYWTPQAWESSEWWEQESHRLVYPTTTLYSESLKSASVDPSNGAFQLQALRVFERPQRLTAETDENGLTSICIRGSSTGATFRITGVRTSLALDEMYQLFILSDQNLRCTPPSSGVLLAVTTEDHGVVTLHDCCMVYDIHLCSKDRLEPQLEWMTYTTDVLHDLNSILNSLAPTAIIDGISARYSFDWIFACIFPSESNNTTTRDLYPLLIRLAELEDFTGVPPELAESISMVALKICAAFDPLIHNDHFYWTIKNETMYSIWMDRIRNDHYHPGLDFHLSARAADNLQADWTRLEYKSEKK